MPRKQVYIWAGLQADPIPAEEEERGCVDPATTSKLKSHTSVNRKSWNLDVVPGFWNYPATRELASGSRNPPWQKRTSVSPTLTPRGDDPHVHAAGLQEEAAHTCMHEEPKPRTLRLRFQCADMRSSRL